MGVKYLIGGDLPGLGDIQDVTYGVGYHTGRATQQEGNILGLDNILKDRILRIDILGLGDILWRIDIMGVTNIYEGTHPKSHILDG